MAAPRIKVDISKVLIGIVLIWLVFFYQVGGGTRSLAEHLYRIVTTPEAVELRDEIFWDVKTAVHAVSRRVRGAVVGYPDEYYRYRY